MKSTLFDWLSSAVTPSSKWKNLVFSSVDEEQLFESRLNETVAWCNESGRTDDPALGLRSELLKPDVMVGNGSEARWDHSFKDVMGAVALLCEKRSRMMTSSREAIRKATGRMLVFWPEETLDCGAAEHTSRGFFNCGNAPPWDTWFWYGPLRNQPTALISWVPGELVDLVSLGISVNPEQCIDWLDAI